MNGGENDAGGESRRPSLLDSSDRIAHLVATHWMIEVSGGGENYGSFTRNRRESGGSGKLLGLKVEVRWR